MLACHKNGWVPVFQISSETTSLLVGFGPQLNQITINPTKPWYIWSYYSSSLCLIMSGDVKCRVKWAVKCKCYESKMVKFKDFLRLEGGKPLLWQKDIEVSLYARFPDSHCQSDLYRNCNGNWGHNTSIWLYVCTYHVFFPTFLPVSGTKACNSKAISFRWVFWHLWLPSSRM